MVKKTESPLDKRFKIAQREALLGVILVIINFVWWYGFGYGLGSEKVENYHYVWGLPAWFFYSCIVGTLVMIILVSLTVKFLLKDVPFEIEEGEKR